VVRYRPSHALTTAVVQYREFLKWTAGQDNGERYSGDSIDLARRLNFPSKSIKRTRGPDADFPIVLGRPAPLSDCWDGRDSLGLD
jgi:hypothetical protein